MKKIIALAIALVAAGFVFAESYTVKKVSGTVHYVENNELKKITPGIVLDETAVINSSASGRLTIVNEAGKEILIAGVKKDALSKLAGPKVPKGNGITLNGTAKKSDVAADKASGKGASTASSRADDVTQNDDWNE